MNEMNTSMRPKEKMSTDSIEVYFYENFPEYDLVAHYHEFYEIHLVINGEVAYWVDGTVYPVHAGNLMLLSPMQLHRPALTDSGSCQRIILWIDKPYIEQLTQDTDLLTCFTNKRHLYQAPNLTDIFQKIYCEHSSQRPYSDLYVKNILLQILIELSRTDDSTSHQDKQSPLIAKIISYICDHFTEDICLDSIAEHFHISKFHLSHLFKTETGTSLYRYVILKRISFAKQLLQSGQPANQVSLQCGFRDYSVFYKAFKAEYNRSPNDI